MELELEPDQLDEQLEAIRREVVAELREMAGRVEALSAERLAEALPIVVTAVEELRRRLGHWLR